MNNVESEIIIKYGQQLNVSLFKNVTTRPLTVVSSYINVGNTRQFTFRSSLSNNVPIVIVDNPLLNNERQLLYLKVNNYDSVDTKVSLYISDLNNVDYRTNILDVFISPKDTLYYNTKDNFFFIDSSGKMKLVQHNIGTDIIISTTGSTVDLNPYSLTSHTHSQYLTGFTVDFSPYSLTGHTHSQYSLTGHTHGWITGTDAFGRPQQAFREPNSVLSLGGWTTDGDPITVSSEGAVFYGVNALGVQSGSNGGYARIKSNRFGLANIITGVNSNNLFYYFRVDDSELYLKDNNNIKTFGVNRATGVVSANMFQGDINWNYVSLNNAYSLTSHTHAISSLSGVSTTDFSAHTGATNPHGTGFNDLTLTAHTHIKSSITDFIESDYVHSNGTELIGGNKTFSGDILIQGNFSVAGTATTLNSENVNIKDNIILLNSGETMSGVSLGISGIDIDRGLLENARFVWNENTDKWEAGTTGSTTAVSLDGHIHSQYSLTSHTHTIESLSGVSTTDFSTHTGATNPHGITIAQLSGVSTTDFNIYSATTLSAITTALELVSIYGSLYENTSTGTTITVSNAGQTGWVTALSAANHYTTLTKNATSDRITILSGASGAFQIGFTANVSVSSAIPVYWAGIYKNNSLVIPAQSYISASNATDRYNFSQRTVVTNVAPGDFFDVRFSCDNATNRTITLYHMTFNINRVGP